MISKLIRYFRPRAQVPAVTASPVMEQTRIFVGNTSSKPIQIVNQLAGRSWEIPQSSAPVLRDIFHPELDAWKSGHPTQLAFCRFGKKFMFLAYPTGDISCVIRVMIRPAETGVGWNTPDFWKIYNDVCETLVHLATAEISRKQLLTEWPFPKKSDLGSLNHEFLAGKQPRGSLRPFQPADAQSCMEIYRLLETKAFVPKGYAGAFDAWVQKPEASQLVLEIEDRIVGCCGCTISEPFDPSKTVANVSRACSLSFGIIHPDFHGQGLGRTQLAVRLALALHLEAPDVGLNATETSRPFLESAGFKFWRSYRSELGDLLHEGALLLTDADTAVLEPWLALLSDECLEILTKGSSDNFPQLAKSVNEA